VRRALLRAAGYKHTPVCLSTQYILDVSRGKPLHPQKLPIPVVFSHCVGLINLASEPPSIITALRVPPSASAVVSF